MVIFVAVPWSGGCSMRPKSLIYIHFFNRLTLGPTCGIMMSELKNASTGGYISISEYTLDPYEILQGALPHYQKDIYATY